MRLCLALALVGLPIATAGCAFEGQIAVQLLSGAPVTVKQSAKLEFDPHRVQGATTRAGQVVKVDCSVTGAFDVREATGSAVLVQLYVVHLRTRPLPRGTPYQLDCAGPLIVQLPTDASDVQATATSASESQRSWARPRFHLAFTRSSWPSACPMPAPSRRRCSTPP